MQQRVYDKLKGSVGSFVSLYAPAAGQPQSDFFASANQALFAENGGEFNNWVAPAAANVTAGRDGGSGGRMGGGGGGTAMDVAGSSLGSGGGSPEGGSLSAVTRS